MTSKSKAYHFLENAGEMGKLIRAKDWSQTPIGNPETWPQPLQHMVRVMLDNPFGMYISWGTDYTQIYNDAFISILGQDKHPQALGNTSKVTFSEIWQTIGPMFERVLTGEVVRLTDFMVPLQRNGKTEVCYFDFSYSPIRLDTGEIGGILATVIETTTKQKVQSNLEESEDELKYVIEAAQLGTFDYNPATNYFSGNKRLKDWFGLQHQGEIKLNDAINSIVRGDRARVSQAIKNALDYESGGAYNQTYTIINAITNKRTTVQAWGRAWFNDDKIAYRFNGALKDVTEQTIAQIKTKEAESHISTMILESPVGICVLDARTLVCETVNDSFIKIAGKPRAEIIGHYYWDTFSEVKDLYLNALHTVRKTGVAFSADEVELELKRHGETEKVYISFVYAPLKDEHDNVIKITVWVQNNTAKVEARNKIAVSERNLRLMILQAPVAIAIFRGTDYTVEIANKFALELWGRTEQDVLNKPILEAIPELLNQGIKGFLDDVSASGKPFSTPEMPLKFVRNGALEKIYLNFSFEPLYDINGKINGIMAIGYDVSPQVKSRKIVEESEQSIRALVESAPFPIGVYQGEELRISLANQSIMEIWGKGDDVVGKLYTDILPELQNQQIFEKLRTVLRTGVPYHAKNQRVDLLHNGELKSHAFNYSFTPLIDEKGKVFAVMNTAAEVTELHEAKQKVEESEKRFRESVKQAPVGIAIFRGQEYKAEMANEHYLQLINQTEEDFLGKPMFESVPEVEKTLAPIVAEIYKTGKDYHGYELPIQFNRNGEQAIKYFNFFYHPLKEHDTISGFIVVATDVTLTVRAKQLIEENEEKLELVIDGSELGIFDVNLKTSDVVASDRCYEIIGFKDKRGLTNEEMLTNFHPEDLEIRREAFKKAFIDGKLHYQARIIWDDKSVHWMDAKGKVFFDSDDKPERILGTIRDITEERRFQQELLEREEKFRLLADSMPQYIWTADPRGNVTYFNQSAYDFSGIQEGQLNNRGWLNMVHPDDRSANYKRWVHSIQTGENYLFEQRFRKHNGEYRWQLSRAIPQRDVDGTIKRWVGTSTDIQEQKVFTTKLETQVRLRTKELEQKNIDLEKMNKELQSFVYISSHDLQEPLRKIQTFSSRIIETEYETLTENAKKYFERMQNSAYRMQHLIQDLIAYSRTNVKDNNYEMVDLHAIIEDVKDTLSEELEQKVVNFKFHDICELKIITVQFKQVILNLMSNAIKFAKEAQSLDITITCKMVNGAETGIKTLSKNKAYSHIRFSDNGIGFEQEYSKRIFEVFQRLHSKDAYTGTGIGLAIVKRIIENHEGAILANGILNEGATFDIYIPAP